MGSNLGGSAGCRGNRPLPLGFSKSGENKKITILPSSECAKTTNYHSVIENKAKRYGIDVAHSAAAFSSFPVLQILFPFIVIVLIFFSRSLFSFSGCRHAHTHEKYRSFQDDWTNSSPLPTPPQHQQQIVLNLA